MSFESFSEAGNHHAAVRGRRVERPAGRCCPEESLDAKGEPIKDSRGEVIRVITIEPLVH